MVDHSPVTRVGPTPSGDAAWQVGPPPLDLVLVLDDSRSVRLWDGAGRAARWLEATRLAVAVVPAGTRVAVVRCGALDRERDHVLALRSIFDAEDRRRLLAGVEAAEDERGGADYAGALRSVIDALARGDDAYGWRPYRSRGRSVGVLLLSDGQPGIEAGRMPDDEALPELRNRHDGLYRTLRERRWPVHTIGMGLATASVDAAAVLREIAERTGGRARLAVTMDQLLERCAEVVAELSGQCWTTGSLDLEPGLRSATFVAIRAGEERSLRVLDPAGREVAGDARTSTGPFEAVTVEHPAAGRWSARVTGDELATIGVARRRRPAPGGGR